jgi:hypothetical protein
MKSKGFYLIGLLLAGLASCNQSQVMEPSGVTFSETIIRSGSLGDNWCHTWAADGHIYTCMDDGWGWIDTLELEQRWNNRVWKIVDGPEQIEAEFLPDYPEYPFQKSANPTGKRAWYGYGIISVDGTIYQSLSICFGTSFGPFKGVKFIYSPDLGHTWYNQDSTEVGQNTHGEDRDDMFFLNENGQYISSFSILAFAQMGRDYEQNKDGYIYVYSPGGGFAPYNEKLLLARVPKEQLLNKDQWEYYKSLNGNGTTVWTDTLAKAGIIHRFPSGYDFYSWHPSVVYNEKLDMYIMSTYGTGGSATDLHDLPSTLMLLWAKNPWGPWTEFHVDTNWVMDHPDNRLYQAKLSPKWISEDGKEMWLIWSDQRGSWRTNYKWNECKFKIEF